MRKKVALVISSNELRNWSGGFSYYKNLVKIILQIKNLDLIIYTDSKHYIGKMGLGNQLNIKELLCLQKNIIFYFRKIINLIFKKDLVLYFLLLRDKIDILSHRRLFINQKIKVFGWIPDLQNKVLKIFFDEFSLKQRESYINEEINKSNFIFVSSIQVKKEFKKYYNLKKTILPLRIPSSYSPISKKKLKNFILFPSQFWKHKNHQYIINVSKILKQKKIKVKFIFCGKIDDYRNENNFKIINNEIKKNKLEDYIQNLGEVSYKKLIKMQSECMAFVNPSFYEGWSTINEEARSLNKYIFLSNIPGHIEQKNYGSIFFDINDPKSLVIQINKFLKKKTYKKNNLLKKNDFFKKKINNEAIKILSEVYLKNEI